MAFMCHFHVPPTEQPNVLINRLKPSPHNLAHRFRVYFVSRAVTVNNVENNNNNNNNKTNIITTKLRRRKLKMSVPGFFSYLFTKNAGPFGSIFSLTVNALTCG